MNYFLVAWLAYACPGGLISGLWPVASRPLVCRPQPSFEMFDPARRAKAISRVAELGPDSAAALYRCHGLECRKISDWKIGLTIKEEVK